MRIGELIRNGLFILLLIGICSCNRGKLSQEDLSNWEKDFDNGMVRTKSAGAFEFELRYLPSESYDHLDSAKRTAHFNLRIARKDGVDLLKGMASSRADLQKLVYYFSYGMESDLSLEAENKEYPCRVYHFERSFDLKPYRTFTLAFEDNISLDSDLVVELHSSVLGTGPVKFRFDRKELAGQLKS
ncbi:hypothetical protein [Aureibacter tunicatorum]|uniref:Lipoprotein n=1 Tax=Aureibacter tunicatorum TaxID=866807 RepID=A0AAE4BRR4_9BACT|nr:hypothetical protein [Aureibacter tunicatorum]MDR6240474.1 hypothetical protein [Aureibacter tunicatorum]BDD05647.1 hypothetical protein AUTU_31300 [Aureibacter tunicatorum]